LFGARTLAMATSAWTGGYLSRHLGLRGLYALGGGVVIVALIVMYWRGSARKVTTDEPSSVE